MKKPAITIRDDSGNPVDHEHYIGHIPGLSRFVAEMSRRQWESREDCGFVGLKVAELIIDLKIAHEEGQRNKQ